MKKEYANLKSIPQFAGMTEDEILAWIETQSLSEYVQWQKEFQENLNAQRKDDLKLIEKGEIASGNINKPAIHIEESIKIDMGNQRCIYIPKSRIQKFLDARPMNLY